MWFSILPKVTLIHGLGGWRLNGQLPIVETWVLYQRPGSFRILHIILAAPRTALFWTEIIIGIIKIPLFVPQWGNSYVTARDKKYIYLPKQ